MNITREEATKRALEFLCRKFPACFFKRPDQRRPLALDIHDEIDARFEASRDRDFVHRAIKAYRNNYRYQRALLRVGAARIDLDGRPAGGVTEQEVERARAALIAIETSQQGQPDDPATAEARRQRRQEARAAQLENRKLEKEKKLNRLRALEARNKDVGVF